MINCFTKKGIPLLEDPAVYHFYLALQYRAIFPYFLAALAVGSSTQVRDLVYLGQAARAGTFA